MVKYHKGQESPEYRSPACFFLKNRLKNEGRTIFEYEDDGEVYQSPHRFEYRLPDKWQG